MNEQEKGSPRGSRMIVVSIDYKAGTITCKPMPVRV